MNAPKDQSSCPRRDDVGPRDLWISEPLCQPGYEIDSVDGEGTRREGTGLGGPQLEECCYPVTIADTDKDRPCAAQ
jgi:hypothetical protein